MPSQLGRRAKLLLLLVLFLAAIGFLGAWIAYQPDAHSVMWLKRRVLSAVVLMPFVTLFGFACLAALVEIVREKRHNVRR